MRVWLGGLGLVLATSVSCASVPYQAHFAEAPGWTDRRVEFAGRLWQPRGSYAPLAAGPNRWSDSRHSVWVDDDGHLHLKLRYDSNASAWVSAEVRTPLPRCYVDIEATVGGSLGALDPQVVVALFVYESDVSEFDVELSRWSKVSGPNAQFVVAPATKPSRRFRFQIDSGADEIRLRLEWKPQSIDFQLSSLSHRTRWTFSSRPRPIPDHHYLHFNVWLHLGRSPSDGAEVEVELKDLYMEPQCSL